MATLNDTRAPESDRYSTFVSSIDELHGVNATTAVVAIDTTAELGAYVALIDARLAQIRSTLSLALHASEEASCSELANLLCSPVGEIEQLIQTLRMRVRAAG